MKIWGAAELAVDALSELLGRIGWLIVLYVMFFGLADVILRYIFNMPSMWISITVQYAMVILASVAGPYALNNNEFVKLDVFYERFSDRTKAIIDVFTSVLTFLYLYVLITKGFEQAMNSLGRHEVTPTAVQLPLYHLKFVIPICAIVTLLVVIKKFSFDIRTIIVGHANRD
ncbi:MAG TPA: TRAP transporter small permease subunit [Pseudogracilibacillus sp.]|nr:TRAP transporter small permease subunit [Pseudogracilibacillus sp.]